MTPDDAHTSHNHGFELPNAPPVVVRSDPRPWRAVAGVAVCLGLSGIVAGLIVARRQSTSDEHITSDALQREELRDGWRTLIAAAARDAQNDVAQASAPTNSANPNSVNTVAAPPNVVVVNVPPQSPSAAPPNVTNINLPNDSVNGSNPAGVDNANMGTGYAPNQSLPAINYSPVQGYIPNQAGYPLPPGSNTPQSGSSIQNGYGVPPGSVAPSVGNGSIPGSTPNPALPNNGLVGTTGTGLPSGPNTEATPSTPVGTAAASPSTPSLPSGFSAP